MIKTILLAAAVAASCPTPKVNVDKTGMPPDVLALAETLDFTKFFPAATHYCQSNGFECLTAINVTYDESVKDGVMNAACGHKE